MDSLHLFLTAELFILWKMPLRKMPLRKMPLRKMPLENALISISRKQGCHPLHDSSAYKSPYKAMLLIIRDLISHN